MDMVPYSQTENNSEQFNKPKLFDSLTTNFPDLKISKDKVRFEEIFLSESKVNYEIKSNFSNFSDKFDNRFENFSLLDNNSIISKKEPFFKKKSQKINDNDTTCKCKNSNCLRLFCSCFSNLGFCSPSCKCLNCLNKESYSDARDFIIKNTKMINKKAFKNKIVQIKEKGHINTDGCNCKKGCGNNYCGCRKVNGNCSSICKCTDCQNNKIFLEKKKIQEIYKPVSRRKHKIIINYKKKFAKIKISKNLSKN